MMLLRKGIGITFILLAVGILIWSCSEKEEKTPLAPENVISLTADCIGCHTNEELLKETANPDVEPPPDSSGEG